MGANFEMIKGMIDFAAKAATFDQLFNILRKSIDKYNETKSQEDKDIICTTCLIISAKKAREDAEITDEEDNSSDSNESKGFTDSLEDFLNNQ